MMEQNIRNDTIDLCIATAQAMLTFTAEHRASMTPIEIIENGYAYTADATIERVIVVLEQLKTKEGD